VGIRTEGVAVSTIATYECTLMHRPYLVADKQPCLLAGGEGWRSTIIARSAGAARYEWLRQLKECCYTVQDGDEYVDVSFQHIRVRKAGGLTMAQLAAFADVAKRRGVPFARIGMKVEVGGRAGVIAGYNGSANFRVFFDDGGEGYCHPTWETVYFARDGAVIKDFRKERVA